MFAQTHLKRLVLLVSSKKTQEPQLDGGNLLFVIYQLHTHFFGSLKKLNIIPRYQPLCHPLANLHQLIVAVSQVGNGYSTQQ